MVWHLTTCHIHNCGSLQCKPDHSFRGIISFFFPFLIYMMPKICSQGYHFSSCKKKEEAESKEGFIFLTHHTKTMSCRIVVSNWERTEGRAGAPSRPRAFPPSKDRLMLQVRDPLLSSVSTLAAALIKAGAAHVVCRDYCMSVLYLWLVLTSSGGPRVSDMYAAFDIQRWQQRDKAASPEQCAETKP